MKKILCTMSLVVALSAIAVAQTTSTGGSTQASNRTSAQKQGRQIDLQSDTQLAAQLENALDARHAKVGDRVILKTTQAVKQNGQIVIPKGSQLIGRVTDVQQQTKSNGESHLALAFDRLRSGSTEVPITASILSIAQAHTHAQSNDSSIDSDLMGQSSASSTRSSSAGRTSNGGGLLGGVGNTVGGAVNTTTSTVGNVAGTTTSAVGSTVGATTSTAGNLTGSLRGLNITQSSSASAQGGSTLSLTGGNLRLESGTTFNLAVSNSTTAGNP